MQRCLVVFCVFCGLFSVAQIPVVSVIGSEISFPGCRANVSGKLEGTRYDYRQVNVTVQGVEVLAHTFTFVPERFKDRATFQVTCSEFPFSLIQKRGVDACLYDSVYNAISAMRQILDTLEVTSDKDIVVNNIQGKYVVARGKVKKSGLAGIKWPFLMKVKAFLKGNRVVWIVLMGSPDAVNSDQLEDIFHSLAID